MPARAGFYELQCICGGCCVSSLDKFAAVEAAFEVSPQ